VQSYIRNTLVQKKERNKLIKRRKIIKNGRKCKRKERRMEERNKGKEREASSLVQEASLPFTTFL
jgi:hypothetical protein